MLIRAERPSDIDSIRGVHEAAFRVHAPPGATVVEGNLVDALRASDAWLAAFSLVAVVDGAVVGHCLSSRAHVGETPVLGLGPIGVLPQWQRTGIGAALLEATFAAADAAGELLIGLLGDPAFYGRFGFVPASDLGITAPDPAWGHHFQVRTMVAYERDIGGSMRYAAPFDAI